MAATVFNSPIAVRASLQVVRTFVRLREILATHKELASKLSELERKLEGHDQAKRRRRERCLIARPDPGRMNLNCIMTPLLFI
ncbi:MAG: hypothetical protein LLH30_04875 [Candidatus Manganitrophus sp. SA1]|nr:hypothetical protein [Candidatus Manganitrophus morganii]